MVKLVFRESPHKVIGFDLVGILGAATLLDVIDQVPSARTLSPQCANRGAADVLVVVEEPATQFGDTDRAEGELRWYIGDMLSVDVGRDRCLLVLRDPSADLLATVAVIDVPAAVVTVIGDLADALAAKYA